MRILLGLLSRACPLTPFLYQDEEQLTFADQFRQAMAVNGELESILPHIQGLPTFNRRVLALVSDLTRANRWRGYGPGNMGRLHHALYLYHLEDHRGRCSSHPSLRRLVSRGAPVLCALLV